MCHVAYHAEQFDLAGPGNAGHASGANAGGYSSSTSSRGYRAIAGGSSSSGAQCTVDYVRFPPSKLEPDEAQCGSSFNGGLDWVASIAGPQIIYVGANSNGQGHGSGFKFDYNQKICPF